MKTAAIGRAGELFVGQILFRMGWYPNFLDANYPGEDVYVTNKDADKSGFVAVFLAQIKTSYHFAAPPRVSVKNGHLRSWRDLWNNNNYHIVIIAADLRRNLIYWKHISDIRSPSSAIGRANARTTSIMFDLDDEIKGDTDTRLLKKIRSLSISIAKVSSRPRSRVQVLSWTDVLRRYSKLEPLRLGVLQLPYEPLWINVKGLQERDVCHIPTLRKGSLAVYRLPNEIAAVRKELLSNYSTEALSRGVKVLADESKPRLDKIEQKGRRLRLHYSWTTYFNTIVTNHSGEYYLGGSRRTVRDLIESGPTLASLKTSRGSNHIGDGTFVLTADRQLVLARRSTRVAHAADQYDLTVSGSGVLSLSGRYSVFKEMRQEIEDEMGIPPEEIRELFLLGVLRNLVRCGKPEMFFLAHCKTTSRQLLRRLSKGTRERYETAETEPLRFYPFSVRGIDRLVEDVLRNGMFSDDLKAGIALLNRIMALLHFLCVKNAVLSSVNAL